MYIIKKISLFTRGNVIRVITSISCAVRVKAYEEAPSVHFDPYMSRTDMQPWTVRRGPGWVALWGSV